MTVYKTFQLMIILAIVVLLSSSCGYETVTYEIPTIEIVDPPTEDPWGGLAPIQQSDYTNLLTIVYPVKPGSCGGYKFGEKTTSGSIHNGLDVASGRGGDKVYATWKGKIAKRVPPGDDGGLGTFVVVEYACSEIPIEDKNDMAEPCPNGQSIYIRYAHMQEKSNEKLNVGDPISPGGEIGIVGHTGNVESGTVLHMETRIGNSGQYPQGNYSGGFVNIGKSFINPLSIFPGFCDK